MKIEEIKYIHGYLVEYFANRDDPISPAGIKSEELLESAVCRPLMTAGGKDAYIGVYNKCAALFHSIINNHCFHNGNKRTALLSTIVYMSEHGYWLTIPTDSEMFEFTRKAAAHELGCSRDNELKSIATWLKKNSRRRTNGEHPLKFQQLREILVRFGYDVGECDGRTIPIYKDGVLKTSILQKGSKGKEDYDKQYIQKLRKKLDLTHEFGVDSFGFYGAAGFNDTLHMFMTMRAKVMRDLATI
ncbi:type II toxin-antitoxin system death-on-curing family toxin [Vibrio ziniensis]|uniref:Type II toxin-antitoxin system death-on-curing family toxin n=1 Tax=Vibrio ziniensis TaxID=2711221 RepID=A0A6G7CHY9_9VIBR|nr:type II toxin-antitoxin system death-on-curing family toxin [Vibrio ziniensis]QIH41761.1 type II toxin-antitoxin system death-on-curing family toxin [Vibrio ziniensis]